VSANGNGKQKYLDYRRFGVASAMRRLTLGEVPPDSIFVLYDVIVFASAELVLEHDKTHARVSANLPSVAGTELLSDTV
jgi:hypothetical protein